MAISLLTIGHGTADQAKLTSLLREADITRVVDVRRFPGSRKHPHVAREALERWLPEAGIEYAWDQGLGGRRKADPASPDVWWRVDAFRAYAGHMRSEEFLAGAEDLLASAAEATTAVMCSESLWWRCHRRMISDFVLLARGGEVRHLAHDGRLSLHPVAEGARLVDGLLVYDADPDQVRSRSQTSSS